MNLLPDVWRQDYWLPPGVTWKDMERLADTDRPQPLDLLIALPLALAFVILRFVFERYNNTPDLSALWRCGWCDWDIGGFTGRPIVLLSDGCVSLTIKHFALPYTHILLFKKHSYLQQPSGDYVTTAKGSNSNCKLCNISWLWLSIHSN